MPTTLPSPRSASRSTARRVAPHAHATPRRPGPASRSTARRVVTALVALVALAAVGDGPVAAQACAEVHTSGAWTSIVAPRFSHPASGGVPLAHAVAAGAARLYVTDGLSILRSDDGGCGWSEVYRLPAEPPLPSTDHLDALPVTDQSARIVTLAVPAVAPDRVLAVLSSAAGTGVDPGPVDADLSTAESLTRSALVAVLRSEDAGGTWRASRQGLPQVGTPRLLRLAPSDPARGYLVVSQATGDAVLTTADGGATWEARSAPAPVTEPRSGALSDLAVDLLDPLRLWAVHGPRLARSQDGGASWAWLMVEGQPKIPQGLSAGEGGVVVSLGQNRTAPIAALYESADGSAFAHVPVASTGVPAETVGPLAGIAEAGGVLVIGAKTFHAGGQQRPPAVLVRAAGAWRTPENRSGAALTGLVPVPAAEPLFAALQPPLTAPSRPAQLVLYRPLAGDTGAGLEGGIVDRDPLPPAPAALRPDSATVTLAPGEASDLPLTLVLPRRPRPMDAFVLFDASPSSHDARVGLGAQFQRVVEALAEDGIDVRYGAGAFTDYPFPPWGNEGDVPYRLERRLAPAGNDLRDALGRGYGVLGTYDAASSLPALYQAATGEGQADPNPTGQGLGRSPAGIDPGQDAGFGQGVLRVVAHLADVPFHDAPEYPGQPFARVADTLRAAGIVQVGLVLENDQAPALARVDLTRMAEATGGLARSTGADCDGDGIADVEAGAPIVCGSADGRLPEALLGVLRAVPDSDVVTLLVSDPALATPLPGSWEVDRRADHELAGRLRLRCPSSGPDRDRAVTLTAALDGEPLASSVVLLRCRARGSEQREEPPTVPFADPEPPVQPQPEPADVPQGEPAGQPAPAGAAEPAPQPQARPGSAAPFGAPPAGAPAASAGAPPAWPVAASAPAPAQAPAPAPGTASAVQAAPASASAAAPAGAAAPAPSAQGAAPGSVFAQGLTPAPATGASSPAAGAAYAPRAQREVATVWLASARAAPVPAARSAAPIGTVAGAAALALCAGVLHRRSQPARGEARS